jgi:MFS superfamily sulfate permease-like transporter
MPAASSASWLPRDGLPVSTCSWPSSVPTSGSAVPPVASCATTFPVNTSGSRIAVAERVGAKTQLTGVVGRAAAIVLTLVFVPGLLKDLPNPTLAAVVIAASLSLADVPGTVRLWRQRPAEFLLSMAAFLGVALLGVLQASRSRWRCRS